MVKVSVYYHHDDLIRQTSEAMGTTDPSLVAREICTMLTVREQHGWQSRYHLLEGKMHNV